MNFDDVKDHLKLDNNLEKLLKDIGCFGFHYSGGSLRCSLPDSKTANSKVAVNMDVVWFYIHGENFSGGILEFYGLVKYADTSKKKESLSDICQFFGFENPEKWEEPQGLEYLVYLAKKEERDEELARQEAKRALEEEYDEDYVLKFDFDKEMKKYLKGSHIELFEEGIPSWIAKRYNIHFDSRLNLNGYQIGSERILFPILHPEINNSVIGIKGRRTGDSDSVEKIAIDGFKTTIEYVSPKYLNMIKGYKKSWFLYGYKENKDYINKMKTAILFEGEKSVLKMSCKYHIGLSVGGHELIHKAQKMWLDKLDNDIEIIIAFDSDIEELDIMEVAIDLYEEGLRKVSYIFDKNNLLPEKSSPIDSGIKTFGKLYSSRVKIDENIIEDYSLRLKEKEENEKE